jgi:FkbM family methyltransferase
MNFDLLASKITPRHVIDIGANKGHWHNQARLRWPNSHFILIEGNPECEDELRSTGAETYIAMLSDSFRVVQFYRRKGAPGCTGCSVYRENTEFYNDASIEPIDAIAGTLDSLLDDRELENLLIKMDVQGSELDVLRGAPKTLCKTKALVLEVSFSNYNQGAPLIDEVEKHVFDSGFKYECPLGDICHPITREIIQQDRLYVR